MMTMATKADVIRVARGYLRDFPKFFQVSFPPAGRTYEMGQPNVDKSSVWVAYVPGNAASASVNVVEVSAAQYQIDERNGLIRFSAPLVNADTIMIEGYYYEWLTPEDMDFYADIAIDLLSHNLHTSLSNVAPAVVDVMGMFTLVQALMGLLSEFSRDIDVIASESIHVVASQRFRMVQSLLAYWYDEYKKNAQALNLGLDRIEVLNLRRRSKTTNRLVPLYREREIGDFSPVERIWTPIDSGTIDLEDNDDMRTDVYVDPGEPPSGFTQAAFF
jgi:hypothetical protein